MSVDFIAINKALRDENPVKRLMAEALLRNEIDTLILECRKAGYTRLNIGAPPGWSGGPSNSISAWPPHKSGWGTRCALWTILDDLHLLKMSCGNGDRYRTFGDQAQVSRITIPASFHGVFYLEPL